MAREALEGSRFKEIRGAWMMKKGGGHILRGLILAAVLLAVVLPWSPYGEALENSGPQPFQEDADRGGLEADTGYGLAERIERASRLRDELLRKQEEIRALKAYYRRRIEELKKELQDERRARKINTFEQALRDRKFALGLQTIRRRYAYILKLDKPLNQLYRAGEALLYIQRLAGIEIQMAPYVGGIRFHDLARQMDDLIQDQKDRAENLLIDPDETVGVPSLKRIWKRLFTKGRAGRKEEGGNSSGGRGPEDSEIWKEICDGNPHGKYALRKLSLEAARCLSEWEGKDLFLNGLTELPAPVARELSQWKGEWLCLNSLSSLTPGAAEALSRWGGTRLSLNGLTSLTPRAARFLSRWKGNEIELAGVRRFSPEVDRYLEPWQEAGGTLYGPSQLDTGRSQQD